MKTAVIYARYSSNNQTDQSIEGQLRVCKQYAEQHGILILDTYIDRAMTGTNDNRADFQRMIKDSGKREWEHVIVYKLDRFSRDKYATAIYKKALKDNGVTILSATECIPDTPEGIIVESLLEGMGQFYSLELSQKVRRGMNESRQKGNFTGGYVLFGYKIINKKVVIDEEQAEIIRYIFNQYLLDVQVKEIIATLREKGIMNRGKPFARNTVYRLLENEKYAGIYRHGDEVFENTYPAIISKETHERVMQKAKANKYGKRSVAVKYLLRDKLKCGYCGHTISAETGTARNGKVKRYYKCFGRKQNNGCKKSTTPKDLLEGLVINTIIEELSKPKTIDRIVSALLDLQEKQIAKNSILTLLVREQKQVESAIENMIKAIEQGVVTTSTAKRLKELDEKREELERKILIEQNRVAIRVTESDIRKYYKEALTLQSQELVNYLVKEVVLYDDKIEIYFNNPTRTSPDENRGFSICTRTVDRMNIEILIK
jgi:DNA invertase Pin-like site-specific DNA recombinase